MSLTRSFCKRSFESQIKDAPKFSFDFDDGTVLIRDYQHYNCTTTVATVIDSYNGRKKRICGLCYFFMLTGQNFAYRGNRP